MRLGIAALRTADGGARMGTQITAEDHEQARSGSKAPSWDQLPAKQ